MNDHAPHDAEHPDACLQCNSPDYEPGYKIRLCKACRKRFSRYPLKGGIGLVAVLLSALYGINLVLFDHSFRAALHYEHGLTLAANREFNAAAHEFGATFRIAPMSHAARKPALAARYYNGHTLTDTELNDVDPDIKEMAERDRAQDDQMAVALDYYNNTQYHQADSILQRILHEDHHYFEAYILRSKCLRYQQDYHTALTVCDQLLTFNSEYVEAILEKAIILLQQNKDKEALVYAEQARHLQFSLYKKRSAIMFVVALARQYNHDHAGAMEAYESMQYIPYDPIYPGDTLKRILTENLNYRNL